MANSYGYGPLGYSTEFTREREAQQAAEERRLKEQAEANAAARAEYLAGLEGARAQQATRAQQILDAELEPVRQQERRRWLSDHPDRTEADFSRVWVEHLRPLHVEARNVEALENMKAQLRGSGRYRF